MSEPSKSWWSGLVDWFADWAAERMIDFVTWVITLSFKLYDKFLTAFDSILQNIPVPAAWANSNPWSGFSPQVLYLLDKFQIIEVLAILAAGYTIRWILNTIPFLRI